MTLRASARCSVGTFADHRAQGAFECAAATRILERGLEGDQGGTSLDARRMSTSTIACYGFPASKPRRSSRKSNSHNLLGGAAVACLVLGCAWTVYANVFRADVYPHLDSARFDAPVIRRPAAVAAQSAKPSTSRVAAAFAKLAPVISAPATVPASTVAVVRGAVRGGGAARRRAEPAARNSKTCGSAEAAGRSAEARGRRSRRKPRRHRFRSPRSRCRRIPPRRGRRNRLPRPSATWRSAPRRP